MAGVQPFGAPAYGATPVCSPRITPPVMVLNQPSNENGLWLGCAGNAPTGIAMYGLCVPSKENARPTSPAPKPKSPPTLPLYSAVTSVVSPSPLYQAVSPAGGATHEVAADAIFTVSDCVAAGYTLVAAQLAWTTHVPLAPFTVTLLPEIEHGPEAMERVGVPPEALL